MRSDRSAVPSGGQNLVIAIGRSAVKDVAPRESAVFDDVVDDWLAQPDRLIRARRRGRQPAGIGIDFALLGSVLLDIIANALGQLLAEKASRATRRGDRFRWWRRRRPAAQALGDGREIERILAALTPDQETDLRAALQAQAGVLGIEAAVSALLANAVIGALRPSQVPAPVPAPAPAPVVVADPPTKAETSH